VRARRILVLAAALGFLVLAAKTARVRADESVPTIDIVARRFEFVPSTVRLKRGETVRLRVTSEDVTHGLFLRALSLDTDLPPDRTQEMLVTPGAPGTYTAMCHHFCGAQHGAMKLTVVVE
jgi:cytochrome c oxidase subunit 2